MDIKFEKMGNTLKNIRKTLGFTQDDFCARIGISKRAYTHYEKGERKIPIDIADKIARMSNIKIEQIVGDINSDNNIIISGKGNVVNGLIDTKSNKKFENLFNLIENYATPKLIEEFETKLLKIKEIHES
jgi:transcriptional regulator with XRE-family HTH domain